MYAIELIINERERERERFGILKSPTASQRRQCAKPLKTPSLSKLRSRMGGKKCGRRRERSPIAFVSRRARRDGVFAINQAKRRTNDYADVSLLERDRLQKLQRPDR